MKFFKNVFTTVMACSLTFTTLSLASDSEKEKEDVSSSNESESIPNSPHYKSHSSSDINREDSLGNLAALPDEVLLQLLSYLKPQNIRELQQAQDVRATSRYINMLMCEHIQNIIGDYHPPAKLDVKHAKELFCAPSQKVYQQARIKRLFEFAGNKIKGIFKSPKQEDLKDQREYAKVVIEAPLIAFSAEIKLDAYTLLIQRATSKEEKIHYMQDFLKLYHQANPTLQQNYAETKRGFEHELENSLKEKEKN